MSMGIYLARGFLRGEVWPLEHFLDITMEEEADTTDCPFVI